MTDIINDTPNISVVTQIEALSWVSTVEKETIIREFIEDSIVLPLSPSVIDRCITIRRGKKIKTPDAIIAATALVNKLTLITSDRDFDSIKGLKVIFPKKP